MSPPSRAASIDGAPVLDLDYVEDSEADTDANFVMTGKGGIVEIQATAEKQAVQRGGVRHASAASRAAASRSLVELQKLAVL